MAVRLSTLAEIKVLSLAVKLFEAKGKGTPITQSVVAQALQEFRQAMGNPPSPALLQGKRDGKTSPFITIGLARQLRIDEDWGTQNIYGIGAPTRPRIVPNNYSVTITAERIQLDTRNLYHYATKPDYWYNHNLQRELGIDDFLLYTYIFVKSKEKPRSTVDIFAVMPRTSSQVVTSADVMIAHNVQLVGYKYSYEEAIFDFSNLVQESLTSFIA